MKGKNSIAVSETATVSPDTRTVRPAVVSVASSASPTSRPGVSSSRNRATSSRP